MSALRSLHRSVMVVACASLFSGPAFAQSFAIAGSGGGVRTVVVPAKEKIEKELGVKLAFNASGSSKGVILLADGDIDLAILSASAESIIPKVNKKTGKNLAFSDFEQRVVFEQTLAVVIHPSNPVNSLTRKQLRDVLSGRINNWRILGGNNQDIEVITESPGSGVRTLVEEEVLAPANLSYSDRARVAANSGQTARFVAQLHGAISPISRSNAGGAKIIAISDNPVTQRFYLVSRGSYSARSEQVYRILKSGD